MRKKEESIDQALHHLDRVKEILDYDLRRDGSLESDEILGVRKCIIMSWKYLFSEREKYAKESPIHKVTFLYSHDFVYDSFQCMFKNYENQKAILEEDIHDNLFSFDDLCEFVEQKKSKERWVILKNPSFTDKFYESLIETLNQGNSMDEQYARAEGITPYEAANNFNGKM